MSDASRIEWTDTTWNPVTGCTPVSPGCLNCYAARDAVRLAGNPNQRISGRYKALAVVRDGRPVFNGQVRLHEDRLTDPLRWRKPRRVFVNSQSDLFNGAIFGAGHGDATWIDGAFHSVGCEFLLEMWRVMMRATQHTFQILTKRPRIAADMIQRVMSKLNLTEPLRNVWLGVSVEDQQRADERIPWLLKTPAAVRFLSCEPLLDGLGRLDLRGINWVIVGGESGPKARPMHPEWVRSIRDQCVAADVPFFFKQWGSWLPCFTEAHYESGSVMPGNDEVRGGDCGGPTVSRLVAGRRRKLEFRDGRKPITCEMLEVDEHRWGKAGKLSMKYAFVGKRRAGRMLDGRTWDELPDHVAPVREKVPS